MPSRGIRVLDLSRLLPGPFLTMVLADMGADVVKVEDPRVGDYLRAFPPAKGGISGRFLAVNRGKRSLALDLKEPAGRDALLRMVEQADVVVESFRPGVMDKLGVGYAALAGAQPEDRRVLDQRLRPDRAVRRARRPRPQLHRARRRARDGRRPRRRRTGDAGRADRRPRRRRAVGRDRDPRARSSAATAPARARTSTSR